MKLKILGRIMTGTVVVLVLFLAGILVGLYGIDRVHTAGENQNQRNVQIRGIRELELMVTELTLTYMDIIIDKDHGTVARERLEYINQFRVELKEDKNTLLSYLDTEEEKASMKRIFDGVDRMLAMGDKELIPAVTGKGGDEVFDGLDDRFDDVSSGIKGDINRIIASISDEIKEADAKTNAIILQVRMMMYGVLLIGFCVGILVSFLNARSISKPVKMITEGARRFAVGDTQLKGMDFGAINKLNKRSDELGDTSKAFFKLIEYQKEKTEIAQQIAGGNLDIEVSVSSDEDLLGIAFSEMVDSLNGLVGQVQTAVEQVNSGAGQVAQASQSLSQGATEQASALEEISSSITEISTQAAKNTEDADEANILAIQTKDIANKGNLQMKDLVEAMAAINSSAEEIQRITKLIDDIAFQTNLLALNANVEAARAGKYGKGFAVVAEEVRNLAGRSADNVKETTAMIEEASANIRKGNGFVKQTADQLAEITDSASKVAALVGAIAAAGREQSAGLSQISGGLTQIDDVTQSNTASAEESASAAEELAGQAQELQSTIRAFSLRDSGAVRRITDSADFS